MLKEVRNGVLKTGVDNDFQNEVAQMIKEFLKEISHYKSM